MTISSIDIKRIWYACGIGFMILAWQLLSMKYSTVIISSPVETLVALKELAHNGELIDTLKVTFSRQLMGLGIGLLIGIITGTISGIFKRIGLLFQPFIKFLLSVPAIIFVTLAMIWLGLGTEMVVFLVALLVFPVMHTNTAAGVQSIDVTIKQMAAVYQVPPSKRLSKIYLPGMREHMITGFSLGMASSLRLTIMSEMLGAVDGMGQRIYIARVYLETEKLFAWIIVLLTVLVILEYIVIRPLKKWVHVE